MKQRKKATPARPPRSSRSDRPMQAGATHESHGAPKSARADFAVAAECTVADAGTLKSGLAKLLEHPQTVTLDISAVQRIDTAGLQVIAAFVREREGHGRSVEWQGSAPAFSTAVRLLGLGSLLKAPEELA